MSRFGLGIFPSAPRQIGCGTGCEFTLSANCGTRACNRLWLVWKPKGALGATTLFVRRVLLSGVFHGNNGCHLPR